MMCDMGHQRLSIVTGTVRVVCTTHPPFHTQGNSYKAVTSGLRASTASVTTSVTLYERVMLCH